jgi:uracil-DNA glycosylase
MVETMEQIRVALRQQLLSDRLLGVTSVPVSMPPRSAPRGRRVAPPRAVDATANAERLRVLDETQVKGCRKCGLSETRTQTVFGQGNPAARLVFVGEAPGFEEDKQGLAFVGPAGQLLTRMIGAMGLTREDVFICNVLKCRPPGNRDPLADEILSCSPYLREQLSVIQPELIVALGAPAAKTLLNTTQSIGKLRGQFHEFYLSGVTGDGPSVPVLPTYHPAYLLRSPEEKGKSWADLQMAMDRLGLAIPQRNPGSSGNK